MKARLKMIGIGILEVGLFYAILLTSPIWFLVWIYNGFSVLDWHMREFVLDGEKEG